MIRRILAALTRWTDRNGDAWARATFLDDQTLPTDTDRN